MLGKAVKGLACGSFGGAAGRRGGYSVAKEVLKGFCASESSTGPHRCGFRPIGAEVAEASCYSGSFLPFLVLWPLQATLIRRLLISLKDIERHLRCLISHNFCCFSTTSFPIFPSDTPFCCCERCRWTLNSFK